MACTKAVNIQTNGLCKFFVCVKVNILERNCEELFCQAPRKPKAKHTKRKEHKKARQKGQGKQRVKNSQMKKTRVSKSLRT
jgi:hypothetical protein